MSFFAILTPRDSSDPLASVVIRDGFSWGAALVPPIWGALNGLWLETFGWLVGLVLIGVAGLFAGSAAAFWLYIVFALWIGFSAADLHVAALLRQGYRLAGQVVAANGALAERDWILETVK